MALATGATKVPLDLLGKGVGYFSVERAAQAAAARGTIDLSFAADGWEDAGYPILLEGYAIAGGPTSLEAIACAHNGIHLLSVLAFAIGVAAMTHSVVRGWIAFAAGLLLRWKLAGFLFGALDSRTFLAMTPLAFVLVVAALPRALRRLHAPSGLLAVIAIGGVVQWVALVRKSEGLVVLGGTLAACVLLADRIWRGVAGILAVLLGGSLTAHLVLAGVAMFDDAALGRYEGKLLSYLRRPPPPSHATFHILLLSAGRYPNSADLAYNDERCFRAAARAHPDIVASQGLFAAARATYVDYVRAHTAEYAKTVIRGALEIPLFIPYATSVGRDPWFLGYLPAKPGVIPSIADPGDVPIDTVPGTGFWVGDGSLLNLRWRYLKLGGIDVALFAISVIAIGAALARASRASDARPRRQLLALASYVALAAAVRAIVPTHGVGLVVLYWGLALQAVLLLGVARLGTPEKTVPDFP